MVRLICTVAVVHGLAGCFFGDGDGAFDSGYLYVVDQGAGTITALDTQLRPTGHWDVHSAVQDANIESFSITGLAVAGDSVWLTAAGGDRRLCRTRLYSEGQLEVAYCLDGPEGADESRLYGMRGITLAGDALYVLNSGSDEDRPGPALYRLDPLTGAFLDQNDLPTPDPVGITSDGEYLFYVDRADDSVYRLDLDGSGFSYRFETPTPPEANYRRRPHGIAAMGDEFILLNSSGPADYLYRVDDLGRERAKFPLDLEMPYAIDWSPTAIGDTAMPEAPMLPAPTGYAWVADSDARVIYQLDLGTGKPVRKWALGGTLADMTPRGLAVGVGPPGTANEDGSFLWLSADGDAGSQIALLDLSHRGLAVPAYQFAAPPDGRTRLEDMAWDGTHLWALSSDTDTVYQFDRTGAVLATYPLPAKIDGRGLTHQDGEILVSDVEQALIMALDPTAEDGDRWSVLDQGRIPPGATIDERRPYALAHDGASLWVVNRKAPAYVIYRLPVRGSLSDAVALPTDSPSGLAFSEVALDTRLVDLGLWSLDRDEKVLYRMRPDDCSVVQSFDLEAIIPLFADRTLSPQGLAANHGRFWVSSSSTDDSIHRLQVTEDGGLVWERSFPAPPDRQGTTRGITASAGILWSSNSTEGRLYPLSASTGQIIGGSGVAVPANFDIRGLATGPAGLLVADDDSTLWWYDPVQDTWTEAFPASVPGWKPTGVSLFGDEIWVSDYQDEGAIWRLELDGTIALTCAAPGSEPSGLVRGFDF